MSKKATKAVDNVFYIARYEAASTNPQFSSREKAAELLGIDRTRLARIELGTITPYPEEVMVMARHYHTPELRSQFCSDTCPLGEHSPKSQDISQFDRLVLKVLSSLADTNELKEKLIDIAADGVISEDELPDLYHILEALDEITANAQALKLWAMKHLPDEEQ